MDSLVNYPEHYVKRPCGYSIVEHGETIEPILYQPTPEGLQVLIDHFVQNTGLRLSLLDQSDKGDKTNIERLKAAKTYIDSVFPEDDKPTAVILSCGQMHALPVLLVRQAGVKHLIILDATCGGTEKTYRAVADAFPSHGVLLNHGTRQADTQSCITDSFEILSAALQIEDVGAKICARIIRKDDGAAHARRLFIPEKIARFGNFHLFRMPEELCFTAQRSEFTKDKALADMHKSFQLAGQPTTLERERVKNREFTRRPAAPTEGVGTSASYGSINHYLYNASRRHKQIIDAVLEAEQAQAQSAEIAAGFLGSPGNAQRW